MCDWVSHWRRCAVASRLRLVGRRPLSACCRTFAVIILAQGRRTELRPLSRSRGAVTPWRPLGTPLTPSLRPVPSLLSPAPPSPLVQFYTWVVQMLMPTFLQQLVYEKEKRLRMMMKMHGLGDG